MGLFYLVLFLACSRLISAATLEPRIFYNLTINEFHAKRSEYLGFLKRTVKDSAEDLVPGSLIFKREVVGEESRNNADQQAIIELRSEGCLRVVPGFSHTYRAVRSACYKDFTTMDWYCRRHDLVHAGQEKHRAQLCPSTPKRPTRCIEVQVTNFLGKTVTMPHCVDVLLIEEEEGKKQQEVDAVPTYEGHITLPYEVWSPGTWDSFYQFSYDAEKNNGFIGHYDYRGHFASGKEFRSQSPNQSHSWACLGCP